MPSRERIIDEIRRVAEKIGRPPGRQVFTRETGIRESEWYGVYFSKWSDALKEAGCEPNKKQEKLSSDYVLRKYAEAVRHYGHVPSSSELRMYTRNRRDVPGHSTFSNHFGNKTSLILALTNWVRENDDFADLISLVPEPREDVSSQSGGPQEGWVYLLKSGNYYKIGRSEDLERRVKQIRTTLPEEVILEHAIRTDDPAGIELYWHRRFDSRRVRGEWFQLTIADVRAFKRRRSQ